MYGSKITFQFLKKYLLVVKSNIWLSVSRNELGMVKKNKMIDYNGAIKALSIMCDINNKTDRVSMVPLWPSF